MSASTAQIIEAENARFSARMAFDLADIAARELVAGRQADFEDSRLRVLRFLESAHAAMTAAGPRCEGNRPQTEALFYAIGPDGADLGRSVLLEDFTKADALYALDSLINAESDDALPVWPVKAEAA